MSFTDQQPWVVTEDDCKRRWGDSRGLSCALCGHKFKTGDTARWVYANGTKGAGCGNFFTCEDCDGEDVIVRGIEDYKSAVAMAKKWGIYGPDWQ